MEAIEALRVCNLVIDGIGWMICIGAVILARRIGLGTPTGAPVFCRDVDREMLRQHISGAFARIAGSLESERRSLETVCGQTAATLPPAPGLSPVAGSTDATIAPMAVRGQAGGGHGRAPQRSPGEVELRLKLKPPSPGT